MEKQPFEVLLKSMDSKINLILECYTVLDKRIADEGVMRKEENDLLNVKISALSNRFDTIDERFDGIDRRLDGIDTRLDGIHSELIDHRNNSELHRPSRRSTYKKSGMI